MHSGGALGIRKAYHRRKKNRLPGLERCSRKPNLVVSFFADQAASGCVERYKPNMPRSSSSISISRPATS